MRSLSPTSVSVAAPAIFAVALAVAARSDGALDGVRTHLTRARERRVDAPRSALVVLDAIEEYRSTFDPSHVASPRRLMEEARAARVPIVTTGWVRTRGAFDDVVDDIGHWSEFVDDPLSPPLLELRHLPPDLKLSTLFPDAFAPTCSHPCVATPGGKRSTLDAPRGELDAWLRARGVATVVLAGTWAEACVRATAATAATLGYEPVVVHAAVGGHTKWSALLRMDRLFAHVVERVTWEEA